MNANNEALIPLLNEATELLKALSHPARMMICCELKNKELSVGEIEENLNIRQPRLSRELAKLRALGLVTTRRKSKLIYYSIAKDSRASAMVDAICAVMLKDLRAAESNNDNTSQSMQSKPLQECGVFAQVKPSHNHTGESV
jgi:DNA-binding transcriptional ArsR family regulator